MKTNESRKKENDREEKWYAKMNAIEAVWRTAIAKSRMEYLENYIQRTKRRPKA